MYSIRWQHCFSSLRQQVTAAVLLVAVVVALFPVSLISFPSQNGKDLSRPFPCQDRPCGCRSAEQCRKKCCCFTASQKLAWAKSNGVKASEVVVAETQCETGTVAAKHACCSASRVAKTPAHARNHLPKPTTQRGPRHKVVIGVVAQECQGLAHTLSGQSVFLLPPICSITPLAEPIGERVLLEGSRFVRSIAEPPVPPPRLIAAA